MRGPGFRQHTGFARGVTSPISSVGTTATGVETLTTPATNVGDIVVTAALVFPRTVTVSSITTAGTATTTAWAKLIAYANVTPDEDYELWYAIITGAGSLTITYAYTGSPTAAPTFAQEFAKTGGIWAQDGVGAGNFGTVSPITPTPLTPTSPYPELYVGIAGSASGTMHAGSTPGYTYTIGVSGSIFAYNTNISASSAPNSTYTGANDWGAAGTLIQV